MLTNYAIDFRVFGGQNEGIRNFEKIFKKLLKKNAKNALF